MQIADLIALIAENLRRMRGRVVMTALGVIVGTAAVVVLISLGAGLRRQALESLGSGSTEIRITGGMDASRSGAWADRSSGTGAKQAVTDAALLAQIEALPGVVWVVGFEPLTASVDLESNRLCLPSVRVVGLDPAHLERLRFDLAAGSLELRRGQALVGSRIASKLGDAGALEGEASAPADLLRKTLDLYVARIGADGVPMERLVRVKVAGVLAPLGSTHDFSIYIAEPEALALNGWLSAQRRIPARQGYSEVLVKVDDVRQAAEVEAQLMAMGLNVFSQRQQAESVGNYFDELQTLLGGIAAVSLLVSAFGIANTMLMAITERTREIGLMKAIGASHRDVMLVFLGEAGSIGFFGGLTGVALAMATNGAVNAFGAGAAERSSLLRTLFGSSTHLRAFTPLWLPFFAVTFAVLIGVLSGFLPARRAARIGPIAALKSR
ncbi:MAG: ABC transporter permease [Anaerolineae bacterium]